MTTLFAQPYDITAAGFYFDDDDTYLSKSSALKNDHGDPVEEFEIQFIDGEEMDCELAKAWELHQGNITEYFTAIDDWQDYQKINFIIAVGECGYQFDPAKDDPDQFDVELYGVNSLKELAEQFVEDGLYGEIPDSLQYYIDTDAMARDLSVDYSQITIAGTHYVYRCQ